MASGEPLDEVQWRSPEWIQFNGGLKNENVLEYFSQSPFYDRTSNNQVLKMQSQYSNDPYQQNRVDIYAQLRNMQGIEFVVYLAREPDLWIIRKQERLSPQDVRLITTYFVVGENIYQAPSVHSVVTSRLLSTALALKQALNTAAAMPIYSPSQGYSYFNDASELTGPSDSSSTPGSKPVSVKSAKSPAPGSVQTPALNSINNHIRIAPVDDYRNTMYMERALHFTNASPANTAYIDSPAASEAQADVGTRVPGTPGVSTPLPARRTVSARKK
ncbi:mediator of RNA polymerase II transcription subunit 6 [Trichomonascus vanleenenianus]|uniref:mediator complex subunit MED6 n=1 Tax=Trichomonascus vanleenenianus TaxID=2268995 RepID=UPI003ECA1922